MKDAALERGDHRLRAIVRTKLLEDVLDEPLGGRLADGQRLPDFLVRQTARHQP